MLSGSDESVRVYKESLGKVITDIIFGKDDYDDPDYRSNLILKFSDNTSILIKDTGQSCCELRYMTTDDNLADFIGATFVGMDIKQALDIEEVDIEEHEVQFLDINTSKGTFTMSTHNEHNGYYGGFSITIKAL